MVQFLVEDLQSLEAAGWPAGEYWSTSTGLPFLLPRGKQISNPEGLVDNDLYQAFGKGVLGILSEARAHFREVEDEDPRFTDFAVTYAGPFYLSLLCIGYKAMLLDLWLSHDPEIKKTVIGSPILSAPGHGAFQFGRHNHIYAALAVQLGGSVSVLEVPPIDGREFSESFNKVPVFDKVWNTLNRTRASLAYKIASRLFRSVGSGKAGILLVGAETDGVEECFLSVIAKGWRVVKVDFRNEDVTPTKDNSLGKLKSALTSTISKHLSAFIGAGLLEASTSLLWSRMFDAFSYHSALVEHSDVQVRKWREDYGATGRPVVFVSGGLYSPEGRILDGSLRRQEIPVICMDHGIGVGLGLRHDFTAPEAISFSDRYLAFNRQIASLYNQNRTRSSQIVTATETPAIMRRSNFPKLQRMAARKYLGIAADEAVLIYVTNLAINNVPAGYGTATDMEYADFQRRLVEALSHFPGRVVIKPYPVYRYHDADQIWQMPLPANAILCPFGEYRHIRWAADVVALDLCSSTFGWAMNSNVPMIYIDNLSGPMTDRAVESVRRSVFYFSSMEDGWESDVEAHLKLPHQDMVSKWMAMEPARQEFGVEFVNGGDSTLTAGLLDGLEQISQIDHR